MDDGRAINVIDVQVSPRAVLARVLWEPMDESYSEATLTKALRQKKGILKAHVNSYLNNKYAIDLEFVAANAVRLEGPSAQMQEAFARLHKAKRSEQSALDSPSEALDAKSSTDVNRIPSRAQHGGVLMGTRENDLANLLKRTPPAKRG